MEVNGIEVRAGQVWRIKSEEQCLASYAGLFGDMAHYCGTDAKIESVVEPIVVYFEENGYRWDESCLDYLVSDVPEASSSCVSSDAVAIHTAFISPQQVARVNELWLLHTWAELSEEVVFQMVDDMASFLGKAHRITRLTENGFEIAHGGVGDDKYVFPYECLNYRIMHSPESASASTHDQTKVRKLSCTYDVCEETRDGMGRVSVKLIVNYENGTYRIASSARDGKFLFDTAQHGNPEIWETILEAIRTAARLGATEVVGDERENIRL